MKGKDKPSTDIAKRGRGRPFGSKDKKKRKRKTWEELKAEGKMSLDTVKTGEERPPRKTAKEAIKKAERLIAKLTPKKEERKCGIKVVVAIVRVDGDSRFKIRKEKMPEIAPIEELVCKITYERNGILLGSVYKEVKRFAEALIQSLDSRL